MVLMDIPRIDVAIAEFARLLVEGGTLVCSITHPCFFMYDWVEDKSGDSAHKAVSGYLTPKTAELSFWGKTLHFHRPLCHYFEAFSQSGFCVDAFREPLLTEKGPGEHTGRGQRMQVPSFVVMRAIRG
jgi:hypothetical protein